MEIYKNLHNILKKKKKKHKINNLEISFGLIKGTDLWFNTCSREQ
jgi:translation elongation factor EF-1beta